MVVVVVAMKALSKGLRFLDLWREMDKNGDGYLQESELAALLPKSCTIYCVFITVPVLLSEYLFYHTSLTVCFTVHDLPVLVTDFMYFLIYHTLLTVYLAYLVYLTLCTKTSWPHFAIFTLLD